MISGVKEVVGAKVLHRSILSVSWITALVVEKRERANCLNIEESTPFMSSYRVLN